MRKLHSIIATLSVALLGGADPAAAQFYTQHNLVSTFHTRRSHRSVLGQSMGLASTSSPFWVSITRRPPRRSTAAPAPRCADQSALVSASSFWGALTGVVFLETCLHWHRLRCPVAALGPARFIFASEDGSISGWNPGVPPPVPPPPLVSSQAIVAVPASDDNVYKGLAIASTIPGNVAGDFLYATNFRAGTVDVFDHTFAKLPPGRFADPRIPDGYAPFGIQNIGGIIYVTYALGRRQGGRRPGSGPWIRERVRHQRQPDSPRRVARAHSLSVGAGAVAG
jgi:uncharacterized protein (TIGR03118 family)